MSTGGKVRVLVSSHRVPSRTIEIQIPLGIQGGYFFRPTIERKIVYESVYDESQLRAIGEARRLSEELGLQLQIVDTANVNPVRRALSKFKPFRGAPPSLVLTKSWPVCGAEAGTPR
jgi:hypothetical protein